ncbi:hypothetical protein [Parafrankia sp. FMc2]|uniref:hypothetical protein n=1 Tax=Parafrankia sp. FMc2 TaxID=3233196 RepID=UPI0034D4F267
MTTSCPDADDLSPAPNPPRSGERQPGVTVYSDSDGHNVHVDRHISADELSHRLALLVPAGARLDEATVLHFRPELPQ